MQTAIRRRSPFALISARLIAFLAVLGPGFITANVDNDPGGILTYSQAGAQFGYTLLWTMIPITLALIVVQEMCARMGVVTGKGLSDLIREEFGLRITFIMMILLVVVNFGNVIGEFSGIAGSMQLFHISKYVSVPICAALVWLLVVKGDYKGVEKVFLAASAFYLAYIFAGFFAGPAWHTALLATVTLPPRAVWHSPGYIYLTVAVIGTTISPWMQFYMQSSVVEKGTGVKELWASRTDVIVGSFFTDIVGWFIVVACAATLFVHGMGAIQVPADAAEADGDQHHHPQEAVGQVAPQQRGDDDRHDDQRAAHRRRAGLGQVRLRAVIAHCLPDLHPRKPRDHPRPDDE